jgi:transcriptional regulator
VEPDGAIRSRDKARACPRARKASVDDQASGCLNKCADVARVAGGGRSVRADALESHSVSLGFNRDKVRLFDLNAPQGGYPESLVPTVTEIDNAPAISVHSHQWMMGLTNTPSDLLPGTLELLILKALAHGAKHGYAVVEHLRLASDDVLTVGESALYPALQRLLLNGWVKAEWGTSENNRRARYYTLTAAGRKQLAAERAEFDRMVGAIMRVLAST